MVVANNSYNTSQIVFERYPDKILFFNEFHPAYITIDRVITPLWLIMGYITNPLSAIVWLDRRLRRNNSSAIYLAALSICDFIYLLLYLLYELNDSWGYLIYRHRGLCETFHFLFYWPQYLSPLLVLGFTAERFIAVFYPFHKEKYCTVRRAVIVMASLTGFAMLLCIMQPVIMKYYEAMNSCNDDDTPLIKAWRWVTEMLVFGIVPLAVLILNLLVLLVIKRLTRQSQSMTPYQQGGSNTTASTVTLLCVSFYLILTTLPVTAVYIITHYIPMGDITMTDAQIHADPVWNQFFTFITVRKLIEEICLSHYCLYFYIYLGTGPQFRNTLKKLPLLKKIFLRSRSQNGHYKSVATNGQSLTTTVM